MPPEATSQPSAQDVRSTFTQASSAASTAQSAPDSALPPAVASSQSSPQPAAQQTSAQAQQTPPVESPPSFSFLDYVKGQGIDVGDIGDDKAAAEAFLDNWRQMQGWISQQQLQQPQQPATPQQVQQQVEPEWTLDSHFEKVWGVPKRDPGWDDIISSGLIVKDPETGQYVPRPGLNSWMSINPQTLQAINLYEQSYGRSAREFLADPFRKTYEALVDVFDRRYAKPETVQQTLEERTVEQVAADFERQHGQWLQTPDGSKFLKLVAAFRATMPPVQAMQEALAYVSPPQTTTAQSAPATASGSAQPAAPAAPTPEQISAQKQESFLQDAKKRAAHSSSGGTPPSAPEDTGAMSADEVRTLFTRTHRKQAAGAR